jgi:hypothetical protein
MRVISVERYFDVVHNMTNAYDTFGRRGCQLPQEEGGHRPGKRDSPTIRADVDLAKASADRDQLELYFLSEFTIRLAYNGSRIRGTFHRVGSPH